MKNISISVIISSVLFISSAAAQTVADGQRFSRNEEYEKAEQVYKNLISKKPKLGDNYYWAALNFIAKGDSIKAVQILNDGLALAPTNSYILVAKGHLELRKHNVQGAESFFTQALSASGKKVRPIVNKEIARAFLMLDFGTAEQLKSYAIRAKGYLKLSNNDFESKILLGDAMIVENPTNSSEAIQQYIVAGYDAPSDPRPILRQAKVYSRAGANGLALSKLDEVLALDKNFAPAYRQKAEVFSNMKERDSAVIYYEEYLRRNDNITARKFYVQSLYLGGDFDRCISEGNKLLATKPIPNIYGVIAYAIAEKDKPKRKLIDSALNYYFANYEELYVKPLNRPLMSGESFIKAILMFKSGVASGDSATRANMGMASFEILKNILSDTSKSSLKSYQRVQDMYFNSKSYNQAYGILELKRNKLAGILNSRDLFFEGRCLAQMNRPAEALKIYQELVTNDTNYLTGYYLIATTWANLDPADSTGNVTKSFEKWMSRLDSIQLIKFKTDRENAYKNMAFFAQKHKDYEKASYYYGKAIELNPEDQETMLVKKRIDDYLAKVKAKNAKAKPGAGASNAAGTTNTSGAAGAGNGNTTNGSGSNVVNPGNSGVTNGTGGKKK